MRKGTHLLAVVVLVLLAGMLQTSITAHAGVPLETAPSWMTPGSYDSLDVALGDMDHDGDMDLASYGDDNIHVYQNVNGELGTTAFWTSTESTDYEGRVVWVDIDKDNYPELVTSEGIYENNNGILATSAIWTNLSDADVFEIGDVDGDGYDDLIVGETDLIELYENSAGTIDDIPDWNTTEDNSVGGLSLGDVDNDGFDELAVGNHHDPIRIYDNVAGSLNNVSIWSSAITDYVGCVRWGDINGDNYPELYACTQPMIGSEPNRIYMNSAGTLEANPSWSSSVYTYASDAEFFDIDDDGDLDLIVANNALMSILDLINGTEAIYLNEGGVIDEDHDWSSTYEDSSYGMDLGDVDGDGYPDLVVANVEDSLLYPTLGGYPGRIVMYANFGPNLLPSITSVSADPTKPETGKESTITVHATDGDDDPLEYDFSVKSGNGTISSTSGNTAIWLAPNEEGTYVINVTVSDGRGGFAYQDFQITVVAPSEEEPFFSLGNIWFLLILIIIIVIVIAAVAAVAVRRKRLPHVEEELPPPPEEELPPPPL